MNDPAWNKESLNFDFFDGKGVIESLMRELALAKPRFKALSAEEAPHLQPGRAAQVLDGGTVLGWIGEIHPLACDTYEVQAPLVAFELDLDASSSVLVLRAITWMFLFSLQLRWMLRL